MSKAKRLGQTAIAVVCWLVALFCAIKAIHSAAVATSIPAVDIGVMIRFQLCTSAAAYSLFAVGATAVGCVILPEENQ